MLQAGIEISSSSNHTAVQADGTTPLHVVGEIHTILNFGSLKLSIDAVVVKNLQCPILGGLNFLHDNDIKLDVRNCKIIVEKYI